MSDTCGYTVMDRDGFTERLAEIRWRSTGAMQAYSTGTVGTPPNVDGLTLSEALDSVGESAEDVPDLLAEVKRLREEVAAALATSRVMQAEQRASVTLAYVQGSLDEAINPTAPIGDEDEDAAPCCYGYITSRGSDHEPDCPESARREG